ncbi:MAG: hypothetical protein M1352_02880 [Patescibacteria group bacterium]|nr:hypothetical protein [Patescibacteria group bacterium]
MKNLLNFLLIFGLLFLVVAVKYHFFKYPSSSFFFLSNSDIMFKATEFLRLPTPIPYAQSYVEYPVVVGIWGTFLAYLSRNAFWFFFLNGAVLCFFSAISIFLARDIFSVTFGREISLLKFLTPSVWLFTFYNWDALAVFFLLASLYCFVKGRVFFGTLISTLGFWTKIFPIFSLAAELWSLFLKKKPFFIVFSLIIFLALGVTLNVRYAFLNPKGWSVFFDFSAQRPPNIDSVWTAPYLVADKLFGVASPVKGYFGRVINYASFALVVLSFLVYFILKLIRRVPPDLVLDTAFMVGSFVLFSKVYSPQYNLWLIPLFIISGLNYRKILVFDFLNAIVTWGVFQYFREVFILGKTVLSFPYFKLFFSFVVLRHLVLILLAVDLWKTAFGKNINTSSV